MLNINLKQGLSIIIAVLGVLMISTTQLTDLFGASMAKAIGSSSALLNSILGSILAVLTSQGNTIKDTLAMPGVEKIAVNGQANQVLASMAVDPNVDKIAPTAAAFQTVTDTAKGENQ